MKLSFKKNAIIALLAASVSFPAFAANPACYDPNSCMSTVPGDFYTGLFEVTLVIAAATAALGGLHLKESSRYIAVDGGSVSYRHAFGSDGSSPFPNAPVIRVAGGYRFYNPDEPNGMSLSFEAGLTSLQKSAIDYGAARQDTLVGSSVQIAAIFAYPVVDRLELTGKIGYASTKTSAHTNVAGRQNVDGSGTHAMFGAGMQYRLGKRHLIRAQYENLGTIDRTLNPAKASVVSAGLAYEF